MLKNLHHANLLVGELGEAESYTRLFCKELGVELANNPDFVIFRMDTFGIDEARELKSLASRKALVDRKFFLILPIRLTLEAQNALLKTFEDPTLDTYFFLSVREESQIIPTLLSRMKAVYIGGGYVNREADKFLSLSVKDRLLFAKKFVDEERNLAVFLDDLLLLLRKQVKKEDVLRKVYNIRRLLSDSSLASRLVIEHLSLVL